ncbi:MAG: hypothetical protein COB53_12530 [Elusimicrobia bacterium]|nr:MAG: hypothetical protein COB53_12530 [Elusimicrobiota bacterium]
MPIELNPIEARVLGALIEKSFTTPDQYPLSFNALQNACNQKSSRDPVLNLSVDEVAKAIASLQENGLARERIGDRVPKYAQYAEHLGAGDTPEILGTLAMLLLRGPQTVAEIRVRTERLCQFPDNAAVQATLQKLIDHEDGPFVARGSRGKYEFLLAGGTAPAPAPVAAKQSPDRISKLEERVAALEERLNQLTQTA